MSESTKPTFQEKPTNKRCPTCGGLIVQRRLIFDRLSMNEALREVILKGTDGFHCEGCGLEYHKLV